jgi:hypothetical protein
VIDFRYWCVLIFWTPCANCCSSHNQSSHNSFCYVGLSVGPWLHSAHSGGATSGLRHVRFGRMKRQWGGLSCVGHHTVIAPYSAPLQSATVLTRQYGVASWAYKCGASCLTGQLAGSEWERFFFLFLWARNWNVLVFSLISLITWNYGDDEMPVSPSPLRLLL